MAQPGNFTKLLTSRSIAGRPGAAALRPLLRHSVVVLVPLERRLHGAGQKGCRAVGPLVRVLFEDLCAAEDGFSCRLALCGGFLFDLADELGDVLLLVFRREVLPARQRREGHSLRGREAVPLVLLSAATGAVLLGAVEPETLQRLIVEKRPRGMHAGPVPHLLDQEFFDPMRQDGFLSWPALPPWPGATWARRIFWRKPRCRDSEGLPHCRRAARHSCREPAHLWWRPPSLSSRYPSLSSRIRSPSRGRHSDRLSRGGRERRAPSAGCPASGPRRTAPEAPWQPAEPDACSATFFFCSSGDTCCRGASKQAAELYRRAEGKRREQFGEVGRVAGDQSLKAGGEGADEDIRQGSLGKLA